MIRLINVSPQLKDAFNPNNGQGGRYVDYSVSWGVINKDAQQNATASASEDAEISRIDQITNEVINPLKIATFENDGFTLDGSAYVPPKRDEFPEAEIGLIMNELSDENGEFSNPQIVTIDLPYLYSWIAFTVNFGLVAASDFTIGYYQDDEEIHIETITGNMESVYVHEQGIEDCNKVIITITKIAHPYTRARISEVMFGTNRYYSKINSQSLEVTENIDPFNERVPANEMSISVDNFSEEYNIFDPSGIYTYLQTRQPLTIKIGAQQANNLMGYVDMGTYYLQSPELKNNFSRMDLKATDLLGVLQDTIYSAGIYKTATLADFADGVASDAGIIVSYPVKFADITITTYIPSVSHAEAFRRIAQAGNTLLKVSRDNVITFFDFIPNIQQTFTENDYASENGLEPSDDSIINTVELEVTKLTVGAVENLAEITGAGVHTIKYNPSTEHDISISGGSVISAVFYCDNAIIEIDGGTATITGKKITESKSVITVSNANPGESRLIHKVTGQPMIQALNGNDVANHYLSLKATKRRNMKMNYRGYPYMEMGDCVSYIFSGKQTQSFAVTKNSLKLSGGMTGQMEAREM